jgi:hypothetical protein
MLIEIRSNVLRQKRIEFHAGLNVVIGDANATNSIGKSTALMLVDFVFGGNSFIELNKDAVVELDHHSYEFCFEFNSVRYYFRRNTVAPNNVIICNNKYEPSGVQELDDFNKWLKEMYASQKYALTFRALVGIFSRIWPKDNVTNVRRPLHSVAGQAASECITILIKIFERYKEIEAAHQKLSAKESERSALRKAVTYSFVDKIGKRKYSENEVELARINNEVHDIKTDLAKYALNIRAVIDKELLQLKQSKDLLLQQRLKVEEKLLRTRRNLQENKYIKSEQFDSLVEFFPEVNTDKIAQIEVFHSSVAALLKKELNESQSTLLAQQEDIESALREIDSQISERLSNFENPTALIEHVYSLSQKWNKLNRENELHEKQANIEEEYKLLKKNLSELKIAILKTIQLMVNTKITEIVTRVYGENAKTPVLELEESSYSFDIVDDTGTGKAFANLVIFDLSIFALTDLPILIHDTPLFKNVENQAVAKFIKEYMRFEKQSFVALDEIKKYGAEAEKLLIKNMIIQVSDKAVLYIKDWRKR